jgi:hypothetical protein
LASGAASYCVANRTDAGVPGIVGDDNAHSGMLYASTSTPVLAHLTIEELTKGAWPAFETHWAATTAGGQDANMYR